MWRLGNWQGSKCKCKCFVPFSLRTKSFTLIYIYGDCNAILLFTSRKKKSRLLFCFQDAFAHISIQMICFSIKLETEWFDIFSRMLFVRVLCKECNVIADELNRMCCNISNTSASVLPGFPNMRKLMKAWGRRLRAFIVFECLENPSKTRSMSFWNDFSIGA